MSQTIEIVVAPNGGAKVQTRGFVGPSCRHASKFIEDALGRSTGERLTAEFHLPAAEPQRHTEAN